MDATLNGPFGQVTLSPAGLTIGRVPDNQLVINDPKSSSRHAEVRASAGGYTLVDLGSTNGTFVNEQRLDRNVPRPLSNGDQIRIGDTYFTYTATGASAVEPTMFAGASSNQPFDATVAAPPPAFSNYTPPPQQPANFPPQQPAGYPQQPSNFPPQQPQHFNAPPAYIPPAPGQMQPPPGGFAPGVPPHMYGNAPAKKSKAGLWITLSIVAVLLVCSLGGFFVFVVNADTPTKGATRFCEHVVDGEFNKAYEEDVTTAVKAKITKAKFVQGFSLLGITKCTVGAVVENGDTATAQVTISNGKDSDTSKLPLKKQDGKWKIDSVENENTTPNV